MRVIEYGRIPRDNRFSQYGSNAFPCITLLSSGRWLASFKIGEKKSSTVFDAVMTYSDDQGKTWSPWFFPVDLPEGMRMMYYTCSLGENRVLMTANWMDGSQPEKPMYDPKEESLKDTKIYCSISENGGETWSEPQLVDTSPVNDPVPLTGVPLKLADGRILCQFEINKHQGDTSKWIHRSAFAATGNEGRTWGDVSIVTCAPDMYYWDQRPCVLSDGISIVDYFWTLDGIRNTYLNIHGRESRDGGATWGEFFDTGIYGQPGTPAGLADGRLAFIDIDRRVNPTITVRLSGDRGRSFSDSLVVYEKPLGKQDSRQMSMNEAWDEMAKFSVGHPNLLDLGGGELLAYWYAGEHCDETLIEFARIALG